MAGFGHGKSAVVLVDERNMGQFLKTATISASMDPADTTTFGKNDMTFIGGLRDCTVSCDGLFSAATASTGDIANFFDDALGGSTKLAVTVGPEGDSTGRRAYLFTADAVTWDISSPIDGVVECAVDMQCSSGYDAGRWLKGVTTSVATASGGAVTFTGSTTVGGSTGGGVGHLHVLDETNLTSATFRIEHSTSGSTWLDLLVFTATTGINFRRSTVAGTVKEKVRGRLSGLTVGATGGNVTWAIAFARNGSPKS